MSKTFEDLARMVGKVLATRWLKRKADDSGRTDMQSKHVANRGPLVSSSENAGPGQPASELR